MTKAELVAQLSFLTDTGIHKGLQVFFVLKAGEGHVVRFADVKEDVRNEIKDGLVRYLQSRFLENASVRFGPLTSADERGNAVYEYDLSQPLAALSCIDEALAQPRPEEFSFGKDNIRDLIAFVFVIGNEGHRVAMYKHHNPLKLIRRDSILGLVPVSDHRFEKLQQDVLQITETFEFLKTDGGLFVFSVKFLEKFHGYEGILRVEAAGRLESIRTSGVIANIEMLESYIVSKSAAKKLLRAKRSIQVLSLPFTHIRTFILNHPLLKNRIRFTDKNDKIQLDTKKSQELFLKLLDDDFLKSELTGSLYDSAIKDALDETMVAEETTGQA